jgi:Anthranilate/para-aminobenzoate synthases component II
MSISTLKVLVVNNLPGDVARMCEHFETLGNLTCEALRPTELSGREGPWDTIIMTGTDVPPQRHMGLYDREIELIRGAHCPVLGICGGHQILALSFGGSIGLLNEPLYGRVKVRARKPDPILEQLDGDFTVFTKHKFYVREIPEQFEVLATDTSINSAYIVKHRDRPLYGVQFHPERRNQGTQILRNFFALPRMSRHV